MNNIPDITDLHKEKNVKQNAINDMFRIVLNKCIEEINFTNKHTDKTFIFFEVPPIIIGFHQYEKLSCINYLTRKLMSKNYLVKFIEPCYLYVDWGTNKTHESHKFQNIIPTSNPEKLQKQTNELLKKYPHVSQVVFVYDDEKNTPKKTKKK